MQYCNEGNLQSNLANICNKTWNECINILNNMAQGLYNAHVKDVIHCDLHSGNVLLYKYYSKIADFGLSQVANSSADLRKGSYGVIPYMAPELFRGQPHSKATDVYAFGIIMWEISSGEPAFTDCNHSIHLILNVCNGLRPPLVESTPDCWIQLMKECWHANPQNRPTAEQILKTVHGWYKEDLNAK